MSKMYEGVVPCPGCGKPGSEKPRNSKEGLCYDCANAIRLGYNLIDRLNLKNTYYLVPDHSKMNLTWYTIRIKTIERSLVTLLNSFSEYHQRYIKDWGSGLDNYLCNSGDSLTTYHCILLPDPTVNAAKEFTETVRQVCDDLCFKESNLKQDLELQLNNERNDIYNEGVAHGRNLLMQLNNGEITAEQINKRIKKY